jgi:hypothetical protein
MARTRKSIQPLNLYKYDVLIEDKATRSDYFKVSQFDGNFYGGRNAFLVAGASVLKPNSRILVEILNKDGSTVYSAPVSSFVEGSSRLIQIEVYNDTPIGAGKLVLLGCAETYLDGRPIPAVWKNKYNVRWIVDVIISPLIENKTPIRFEKTPSIVATEKFYYAPSSSVFVQQLRVPVDVELTQQYFNVFPNGYLLKTQGSSQYNSDYLDGFITGTIAFSNSTISETASINIPITKIYNNTLAESQGVLIYTNKNNLISNAILSSSGIYTASIQPFGVVTVSSSINIQYNKLLTVNTGSSVSFAKLRLVDLKTTSGEIHKVRLAYKPSTEPGEFIALGDVNTTVSELLTIDSSSRMVETGQFADIKISDYWYSETMSLQKNASNPILPAYYISSSLSSSYLPIVQSSTTLMDAISSTPQIVNNSYVNNISYFIGTKNTNTIQIFPRVEYTLTFDAIVSKMSSSITLNQDDYSLEIYLVREGGFGTQLLETDSRGQLLGTLTPIATFQRQNFENTEFNFTPKIITTGNFGLRFVAYGGFWDIANVSIKPAQEPFFSPDEIDILIPNTNYQTSVLTFRADYLDVNNNSTGLYTISTPVYFTGSIIPQTIAASASYAVTASYVLPSGLPAGINTGSFTGSFKGIFTGDGSGLIGLTSANSGSTVSDHGTILGNAAILNFTDNLTVSLASSTASIGLVTASFATTASFAQKVQSSQLGYLETTYYVTQEGSDANDGKTLVSAFRTIKAAAVAASASIAANPRIPPLRITIKVKTGYYIESASIWVPPYTSIYGDDLRTVVVSPTDATKGENLFLMNNGTYAYGLRLEGCEIDNLEDPRKGFFFAFAPSASIATSPYIQNCTSARAPQDKFYTPLTPNDGNILVGNGPGGMIVDDSVLDGYSPLKSMIVDAYTQVAFNGIGLCVRGRGYAQQVSFFTNFSRVGIFAIDGGHASLLNSNTTFGDYGLRSKGKRILVIPDISTVSNYTSSVDYATVVAQKSNIQTYMMNNLIVSGNYSSSYSTNTAVSASTIKDSGLLIDAIAADLLVVSASRTSNFVQGLFQGQDISVGSIYTINSASGFDKGAIAAFRVNDGLKMTHDFTASYKYIRDYIYTIGGLNASAKLKLSQSLDVGIKTLQSVVINVEPTLLQEFGSLVTSTSHDFSYAGSGVNFLALPANQSGVGVTNIELRVYEEDGGRVYHTSGDETGDFYAGNDFIIRQDTGTIDGRTFSKSIAAQVTPLQLALESI